MAIIGAISLIFSVFLYWLGFSINHIVLVSFFLSSIVFGAFVIADEGEEKKENMFNDFGQSPKDFPSKEN
ncbi:MAG: hypothetical protein U0354_07515 [Candidatus Sericytochromatia bacterium]